MSDTSPLRSLPPVHAILDREELAESLTRVGRGEVVRVVRAALAEARAAIREGRPAPIDAGSLAVRAREIGASDRTHLRPVINATGILLNTGLGRAPLSDASAVAVDRAIRGYCNLEYDLDDGIRGSRTTGIEALLRRITGAEAATVVNNNAAATVLALRALANGREVIVSRGQLVEIGGSFRLPEIMEVSGARLREVGTTNKTRLERLRTSDRPRDTAAILKRPSRAITAIVGFVESVAIAELSRPSPAIAENLR